MKSDSSSAAVELALWRQLRQTPELLADIAASSGPELHRQAVLRKKYSPELVRLGLELTDLRNKAPRKFSRGSDMWLTRQALEQATAEPVARYKATEFARRAGGVPSEVFDACTGLGGDAIALAKEMPVIAHDLDPVLLELAQWNAELYGVVDRIEFRQQDVRELDVTGHWLHIDPDQRDAAGRRQLRLEQITPDLPILQKMAADCRGGAIKLSPASNFGGKFPQGEMELVSWQGECKLACIWCGELAEPGLWRASVIRDDGQQTQPEYATLAGDPLAVWPEFSGVERYLYDPDPSVVRAGLVNLLAQTTGCQRLDDADEYLASAKRSDSPFLTGFEVLDVLTRNEKELRKYLREHNVGTVEIKCRQVPLDVEKLRQSLPLKGDDSLTLVYARVAGKTHVVVCRRLPPQADATGCSS